MGMHELMYVGNYNFIQLSLNDLVAKVYIMYMYMLI